MNCIGLDLGTGAVKGVCWNSAKGILKKISERVAFEHPAPDWIEIDPETYRKQIFRIIAELAQGADGPVDGIAFAAASGNTMLCDRTGTPRTKIISWLDTRLKDWLPPEEWQVRPTTGWPRIPTFTLMHLEYFRRTAPGLLADSQISMNNDYLTWELCGNHTLDSSNAAPFYLWDQAKQCPAPYLDHYGIKPSQLPAIVKPGTPAGCLKKTYCLGNLTEKTVIAAGSFDHPAGARAAGVLEPGSMLLSCGTSWVGFYPVPRRDDVPMNELCDTFRSGSGGCWGAMFSLAKVGVEVEDFICGRYGNRPRRYEEFNSEAEKAGSPAHEMMLSVIRRFKERFDRHAGVKRIVLSGGPSEGKTWPKLIEECLKVEVEISPYHSYTGAVGAAQLAGGVMQ